MKKRSRLVALTALLLCMAMIWSCDAGGSMPTTSTSGTTGAGSTGNGTTQTTGGSVDPPDPTIDRIGREVDHLTLAQNGKTEYRLIYNLGMRGNKKDLVMHFADLFYALTGAQLELCDDFEAEDEPRTLRTAKEIVIGFETTREDLYTVDSDAFKKGYEICVDRERLVISAESEIGMWLAMCQFFSDAFGVDISQELSPSAPVDCVVSSDYSATRSIINAAFFALGEVSDDFTVVADAKDEMQVRAAYRIKDAIKVATGEEFTVSADARDAEGECILLETDPTIKNGDWKLTIKGDVLTVTAGDYYGFAGAAAYFEQCARHGAYTQLTHGVLLNENFVTTLKEHQLSSAYAFEHAGDVRVMFHNVLFYDPLPAERNRIQTEMFKIYMPDVLGLQEFNNTKRGGAGENDLCKLLAELGYVETIEPAVKNAYSTSQTIPGTTQRGYGTGGSTSVNVGGERYRTYYNHTPLFYNTNTTRYIDGGYYWYVHQVDGENRGNCGAGDCASKSATWGVFEDIETCGRYIVISTHMCTRSSGVRKQQGYEMVALIEQLLEQYDLPVFLGGDMNSSISSDNCEIFTSEGELQSLCSSEIATLYTAKVSTSHAYPVAYYDELMGKNTVASAGSAGMSSSGGIDHIFVRNLGQTEVRVYGAVIDEYAQMGSDHVPLFTDFSFIRS